MTDPNVDSGSSSLDSRVESLLSQLTLKEKVALLSGCDTWSTVPIERLGIPSRTMTDGPHGGHADRVEASLARPPKELKGFAKVFLKAGETQAVHFDLNERAFAFYDSALWRWVVEPGEFEILVGSSSHDIRARAALKGE